MHGIWNICLGAATILPVWAAPLPTSPAIAGETAEHRTAEAAEEPAPVRDRDHDANAGCR